LAVVAFQLLLLVLLKLLLVLVKLLLLLLLVLLPFLLLLFPFASLDLEELFQIALDPCYRTLSQ
jgi:hypothetical protein